MPTVVKKERGRDLGTDMESSLRCTVLVRKQGGESCSCDAIFCVRNRENENIYSMLHKEILGKITMD